MDVHDEPPLVWSIPPKSEMDGKTRAMEGDGRSLAPGTAEHGLRGSPPDRAAL